MKMLGVVYCVLCTAFSVNAQMATFKKELVRPKALTYYALNHLGDTSSIVDDEIAKETVLKTFTFKDPFLGRITQYDERNPLQQLVFYRGTQQLVLLDNQLSIKEKMMISEYFPEIDAAYAALTAQSSIWIFDYVSKRWCIITANHEQSAYVSNPIPDYDVITTYGNFAYWQSGNTVYGIDIYGKIMKEQLLPDSAKLLAINGSYIVYQLNNAVFLLNTEQQSAEQLREIDSKVEKTFFNAQNISFLTSEKLYLYNIN